MRVAVVGTGTIGSAVVQVLEKHGHDVVTIGRTSGDHRADISKIDSIRALFETLGRFDAVACCAGDVFPAPLALSSDQDWSQSIAGKGMGQINLVRAALPFMNDGASFVLISGVLTDAVIHAGTIGTAVNHLVEGFVKGAAAELPRGIRINCVSPTVLAESTAYHAYFTGFPPVAAQDVALAYLRAMATPMTGRILKLHKTDC